MYIKFAKFAYILIQIVFFTHFKLWVTVVRQLQLGFFF